MHLSKEIQSRLDRLSSNVKLAFTMDGILPNKYAFYNKAGRSFRTEFASTETEFSIVLFERTDDCNYENCFARGLFYDVDRLSKVINLWVGEKRDIGEIESNFSELETYKDFDFQNSNPDIDKAWTKVKNMFFNDTEFWKDIDWNNRYLELLTEAKKYQGFFNLYPFTSHYWLRFSIDKNIKETWPLDIYIIPTTYSDKIPKSLGKFYVSIDDKPIGGRYFEIVKEALDFYAEILLENKPINWI